MIWRRRRAVMLVSVSFMLGSALALADEPLRIMPIGDSTTVGYLDANDWGATDPSLRFEFGYRSGLYSLLTDAGYDCQFVGGLEEPWNGRYGDPTLGGTYKPPVDLRDFGQDGHRAAGGWRAIHLNNNIVDWLAADDPDVILLQIGTNLQDQPGLNQLVGTIFQQKPDVHLVVAEIMPKYVYSQSIVDYNTYVRDTLVPSYQMQGFSISSVNQYANFLTLPSDLTSIDQSLFSNGINHPSTPGYEKMSETWFDAIESLPLSPQEPGSVNFTMALHGPFIPSTTTDEVFFAAEVSSSDLLNGVAGTHVGWRNSNGAQDVSLNDGDAGGDYDNDGLSALNGAAWANDGDRISTSEYVLGLGSEGLGYDITEIQSIAAWQGAGFPNQKYEVSVRYAGDDSFTLLLTVDYQPFDSLPQNNGGSTKVNVTDDSGTLARGVEAIKFSILDVNSPDTAGTVYREIDVFGVSSMPTLTGDFNEDGIVNLADYTVSRDNMGASDLEPYELADGNGDGTVNAEDYVIWKSQFGEASTAAPSTDSTLIPEPSAKATVFISAVCGIFGVALCQIPRCHNMSKSAGSIAGKRVTIATRIRLRAS